jgi:hypothetical protein
MTNKHLVDLELRKFVAANLIELKDVHYVGLLSGRELMYDEGGTFHFVPLYELNLDSAFHAVEAMRNRGYRYTLTGWDPADVDIHCVEFQRFGEKSGGTSQKGSDAYGEAEHTHLPTAICLAIKKALESEKT